MEQFDVVIVGGGHAGCEAALASARMGQNTALISLSKNKIAEMACNPSIGGVGKGQLVKEIDALGGEMGKNADETGIQFRRLNTRKGSAVQSSRCQSDKELYAQRMQRVLSGQTNLKVIEGEVLGITLDNSKVRELRVRLGGGAETSLAIRAVVLTTGTFMQAIMHCGDVVTAGGRFGEAPVTLSDSLREFGFSLMRLKTGTPPRLLRGSLDYSKFSEQPGDAIASRFSFSDTKINLPQVSCHLGFTNPRTHEVIAKNLNLSPLYSGKIKGIGPRYCPSIEDKVVKFPDKSRHQIFFEPVSLSSDWIYPSAVSTSLPAAVQEEFIKTIEGCENAEFARYGYAVEYDCVDPIQLKPSLESKTIEGLFLAGQVNGTSGYEEAAAQGLIAGINAASVSRGTSPFEPSRVDSYIGVMIDDLISLGVTEPYRMFTSRSEFRLSIREDNADQRLTPIGKRLGLVTDAQFERFQNKMASLEGVKAALCDTNVKPSVLNPILRLCGSSEVQEHEMLSKILKRPEVGIDDILHLAGVNPSEISGEARETLEIEIKYEGYIGMQRQEMDRLRKMQEKAIPCAFNYADVAGLSFELKEKLGRIKPKTLAEAAKISGVTPAALTAVLFSLRNGPHEFSRTI